MKVFIDRTLSYSDMLLYIWKLFSFNQQIENDFVTDKKDAEFIISEEADSDIKIAKDFYRQILNCQFDYKNYFKEKCIVLNEDTRPDYLATAFYMTNCLQEYGSDKTDEIGRFPYSASYQYQFGNITENLVQQYFDKFASEHPKLSSLKKSSRPTQIFLSHDLDSINSAILQDGMAALKQGNLPAVFQMLFNVVLLRPDWLNMDKIMKIESEYDAKSTFFWLVNKGSINARMTNSDYNIRSNSVRKMIGKIEASGWENGLHKSISSDSFTEEIKKLGISVTSNRNHYLKINLPGSFLEYEKAGLQLDASVGFAEHYGFRNSYGLPFSPFNFKSGKAFSFTEVPLHAMDGTFHRYMKIPASETSDHIIQFVEKNKYNCVLSVLWHNTFFTDYKYKGFPQVYKKLLSYFYDNKIKCITSSEIIKQYKWKER